MFLTIKSLSNFLVFETKNKILNVATKMICFCHKGFFTLWTVFI